MVRNPGKFGVSVPQKARSAHADSIGALSSLPTFILRESGFANNCYQPKALNRRVAACLRALCVPSEQAGIAELRRKPELLGVALSALLIGVSGFFRDTTVFEQLQDVILPRALKEKGALRVYSAGCSAGQELYSVGMILDQLDCLHESHLLGVDCRLDAIEQARSGVFRNSDLNDLKANIRHRYFRLNGRSAYISPHIREKILWYAGDVGVFHDEEPADLVLFRNVAIYLEPQYASSIWHRLNQQIRPGGVILTGSAERPPENLGWKRESACIYRKSFAPIL